MKLFCDNFLSKETLENFHLKVTEVIEKIGIRVTHEKILKRLSEYNGVKIKDNTVTFNNELINKLVFNIEFDLPTYFKSDNFLIITGNMNPTIKDVKNGKVRFAVAEDLLKITKLEECLSITGTACVRPNNLPKHLQEIFMYKVLWENSRYKGNDIFEHNSKSTIQACRYIQEMSQILNKRFTVGTWMESPRSFNNYELEIIYHYLDTNVPIWVGNFPIYGVSTPIFMESGMVQAAAELFSGYIMLKLLHGESQVYIPPIDSIMGHPFDWKYGTLVYSSVEDMVKTIYQLSINSFYNIPIVGMSMLSCGKEIDYQQGFEKGVHTLLAAMYGARAFRTPGYLASDYIFSTELLMADYESMKFIENIFSRRDFDIKNVSIDEVNSTSPGGNFFGSENTAKFFRKEYFDPDLFDHSPFASWKEKSSMSIEERAGELIEQKIKNYHYQIEPSLKDEVDILFKKAINDKQLELSYKGR